MDLDRQDAPPGPRARPVVEQAQHVAGHGRRLGRRPKGDNFDALVIEKGLPSSLLGMTYLGRLSRFEATKTALILKP